MIVWLPTPTVPGQRGHGYQRDSHTHAMRSLSAIKTMSDMVADMRQRRAAR